MITVLTPKPMPLTPDLNGCCGLNCVPQKELLKSSPPGPVKVTLFGNRVFADAIKLDEVVVE